MTRDVDTYINHSMYSLVVESRSAVRATSKTVSREKKVSPEPVAYTNLLPDSSSDSDEEDPRIPSPSVNTGFNPLRALLPPSSRAVQMATPVKSKAGPSASKQLSSQKKRKRKTQAPSTQSSTTNDALTEVTPSVDMPGLAPIDDFLRDGAAAEESASSALPESSARRRNKKVSQIAAGKPISADKARALAAASEAEANRRNVTQVAKRLRNFLKLPKAHRWISYEFFYSHIDK